MPLASSGAISLGGSTPTRSIALELGLSATGQISLNDSTVRNLANVASGTIIMPSNFYGRPFASNPYYVGGTTYQNSAVQSSVSISLTSLTGGTDSAPIAGDLVIVFSAAAQASTISATGYTQLFFAATGSPYVNALYAAYKFMGSTPDSTITLVSSAANSINNGQTVAIQVFRGIDSNLLVGSVVSAAGTGTVLADPPAILPNISNTVIVAGGMGDAASAGAQTFSSTNLQNFISIGANGINRDSVIGMGNLYHGSGTFDPAQFSFSGVNPNTGWRAITLALKTAGAPSAAPVISAITPSTGSTSGGTGVFITGNSFTAATAVSIGGTAVTSFTILSPNKIFATIAARAAGSGLSVQVTTPNGTNSANSLFTYTATSITGTITYSLGTGGVGGTNNVSGGAGGTSTFTYNSVTYTANGGAGGTYNTNTITSGGTASGGLENSTGGTAAGTTGDKGGTGGGGINGGNSTASSTAGSAGGSAVDFYGLSVALAGTSYTLGNGAAGGPGSASTSTSHGSSVASTAIGAGGGGAGYYGGNGGNGGPGGGGGGAAGLTVVNMKGGNGGNGILVIRINNSSTTVLTSGTSYSIPAGTTSMRVWLIGAGGGGGGATNVDAASSSGGGAGGIVFMSY